MATDFEVNIHLVHLNVEQFFFLLNEYQVALNCNNTMIQLSLSMKRRGETLIHLYRYISDISGMWLPYKQYNNMWPIYQISGFTETTVLWSLKHFGSNVVTT